MGLRGPKPKPPEERLGEVLQLKFRLSIPETDIIHRIAVQRGTSVNVACRRLLREALLARNLVVKLSEDW